MCTDVNALVPLLDNIFKIRVKLKRQRGTRKKPRRAEKRNEAGRKTQRNTESVGGLMQKPVTF